MTLSVSPQPPRGSRCSELKPKLHLFVCINDRGGKPGTKPSCGPRMKREDVKELKKWVREQGWTGKVFITVSLCLGGCNPDGGVFACYPGGEFYKGVRGIDELKEFVSQRMRA